MSAEDDVPMPTELVIIKRRGGGEEDGHHGGAWKIAYADFMTAMMAFFLVMWLVNASDKKTVTQLATYFNPLRLSDRTPIDKGIRDPSEGEPVEEEAADKHDDHKAKKEKAPSASKTKAEKEAHDKAKAEKEKAKDKHDAKDDSHAKKDKAEAKKTTDEELFADPYGILARLAMQAVEREARDGPNASHAGSEITAPGQAYRDPFDPIAKRDPSAAKAMEAPTEVGEASTGLNEPTKGLGGDGPLDGKSASADKPSKPDANSDTPAAEVKVEAAKIEAEIKSALAQARPGSVPNIEVKATSEGVLISLTDEFDFGMFDKSSATPRPELVVVMGKIGAMLKARDGNLVVRGHTDGRPYKAGGYDNWRLSTARAHMAYHMLVRGGLPATRFERIEGHADRSLKVSTDPLAARNRRIEILLRQVRT